MLGFEDTVAYRRSFLFHGYPFTLCGDREEFFQRMPLSQDFCSDFFVGG